jgi:hypothetical protein
MPSANGMSPQQIRLFHLQAGRAWGNFTASESATLNSEAPRRRREATPADLSPYIRMVAADVILQDLRTVAMPGE